MIMTDPIADMLTRIRNALQQKHETVSMPVSKEKKAIAEILKEEGYITDYKVEGEGVHKDLTITLKYISTSNGMMTDKNARKNHLGGEVIAYIW